VLPRTGCSLVDPPCPARVAKTRDFLSFRLPVKFSLSILIAIVLAACARERTTSAIAPVTSESKARVEPSAPPEPMPEEPIPKHLEHFPGLYVRKGTTIVDAPAADVMVAKGYPRARNKGKPTGASGERLTLLTEKTRYKVGEEIRVLHVYEATLAGLEVYVMGPKEIFGEEIDGKLVTKPAIVPTGYDGAVMKSPWADYNYDITVYKLPKGPHRIQWKSATFGSPIVLESNVLAVEVD